MDEYVGRLAGHSCRPPGHQYIEVNIGASFSIPHKDQTTLGTATAQTMGSSKFCLILLLKYYSIKSISSIQLWLFTWFNNGHTSAGDQHPHALPPGRFPSTFLELNLDSIPWRGKESGPVSSHLQTAQKPPNPSALWFGGSSSACFVTRGGL